MKNYTRLIIGSICLLTLSLGSMHAQNFSGIATYHSASQMQIRMAGGSKGHQMELSEDMKKQLNKAMQKEYTLKFNVAESSWKEAESLDGAPSPAVSGGGGAVFSFSSSSAGGVLYKNTGEGRYEEEANIFGKPFLVKDKLETYEWELTGETKTIGNYNVQKAIYSKVVERKSISFASDEEEDDEGMKIIQDTLKVTAWFAPEIPVAHGPDDYWGLPGLILEVNNGSTTMVCSKVVLNPADGVELEKPAKGKVVDSAEFKQLQEEKIKEMSEKFKSGKGNFVIKRGN